MYYFIVFFKKKYVTYFILRVKNGIPIVTLFILIANNCLSWNKRKFLISFLFLLYSKFRIFYSFPSYPLILAVLIYETASKTSPPCTRKIDALFKNINWSILIWVNDTNHIMKYACPLSCKSLPPIFSQHRVI